VLCYIPQAQHGFFQKLKYEGYVFANEWANTTDASHDDDYEGLIYTRCIFQSSMLKLSP
jgi:hypothetical protein